MVMTAIMTMIQIVTMIMITKMMIPMLEKSKTASRDVKGKHSEGREVCGKGFVPSLLRGDPQHSCADFCTRPRRVRSGGF